MSNTAGIVGQSGVNICYWRVSTDHRPLDTGTTLLLFASEFFKAYQDATGATMDPATGLLKLTQEQYKNLESLFFKIGDVTYIFPLFK